MQADEFDEKFDRGEDITSELDVAKADRPGESTRARRGKATGEDLPAWMIAAPDCEARDAW